MRSILMLTVAILFALATPAWADGVVVKQSTCSLGWTAPQTNADATNLADLAAYGVYVAATPSALAALTAPVAVVPAPALDPPAGASGIWPCKSLAPGQYYVQLDAVDTAGNRSVRSAVVPFVSADDVAPAAPTGLSVTGP